MRKLFAISMLLASALIAFSQAPINPYSQGDGFNGQGWSWNADNARWEMQFLGQTQPSHILTGLLLARGFNGFSFVGDRVINQSNCSTGGGHDVAPTTTEPTLNRCGASAGAGNWAWSNGSVHLWRVGNYLRYNSRTGFGTTVSDGSTANNCYFWGLRDSNGSWTGTCDQGGNLVLFKYDAATNGNIRCITRDGTTTTDNDSGVAADTALHIYDIKEVPGTSWLFYIDGVLKCTNTTNRPAAGTIMANVMSARSDGPADANIRAQYRATQMRIKP